MAIDAKMHLAHISYTGGTTGMPKGVIGRIGVSDSGADSNRVYALVENDKGLPGIVDHLGTAPLQRVPVCLLFWVPLR